MRNLVNRYFPNDEHMISQDHVWQNIKVKVGTVDFHMTESENAINIISDSTWWSTFNRLAPVKWSVILNKQIHNYLRSLLKYSFFLRLYDCVKMDFLPIRQPTEHIPTDWVQKEVWESSRFLLSKSLKRLAKCKRMSFFSLKFEFWKIQLLFMKSILFMLKWMAFLFGVGWIMAPSRHPRCNCQNL